MNSAQIITMAMLATNAIIAAVLGGIILYKGAKSGCGAQVGYGSGMVAFSVLYSLVANDATWLMIGVTPSVFAIAMLIESSILDRVSQRCESIIDRVNRANLVAIKAGTMKG